MKICVTADDRKRKKFSKSLCVYSRFKFLSVSYDSKYLSLSCSLLRYFGKWTVAYDGDRGNPIRIYYNEQKKILQAVKIKSRWHEIVAGATEGLKRKDWMHVSRPSFQVEILKIRRKSHKKFGLTVDFFVCVSSILFKHARHEYVLQVGCLSAWWWHAWREWRTS